MWKTVVAEAAGLLTVYIGLRREIRRGLAKLRADIHRLCEQIDAVGSP